MFVFRREAISDEAITNLVNAFEAVNVCPSCDLPAAHCICDDLAWARAHAQYGTCPECGMPNRWCVC